MKKKKNNSGEDSDSGEIFPIDTLGIPILLDIVEAAAHPDEEEELGTLAGHSEIRSEPLDARPAPGQGIPTQLAAEVHLDQITDKIAESVTREVLAALEPLVREKVNLALRMYEDELLKLPDEENGKKLESD